MTRLTEDQRTQLRDIRDHPRFLTGMEDWFRLKGLIYWDHPSGRYELTEAGKQELDHN